MNYSEKQIVCIAASLSEEFLPGTFDTCLLCISTKPISKDSFSLSVIPCVQELTGSPWSNTIALIPTSGSGCRQPLCAADTCLLVTRPSHQNTHSRPCSLHFPQPVSFHTHLFPLSICVGVRESLSFRYLPLSLAHSVNQWRL